MGGEGGEWDGRGVRVGWALGFGDYLDAGLPVAKSATNPYTTVRLFPPLLRLQVQARCGKTFVGALGARKAT